MMEVSQSELHYDAEMVDECDLYHNQTRADFHKEHQDYTSMLDQYSKLVRNFQTEIDYIRLVPKEKRENLCKSMDKVLHEAFPAKDNCSLTGGGFVETLLPPLRHPRMCEKRRTYFLRTSYLVHDFGKICRQLDPTSRTVFFDLGASLKFHSSQRSPALALVNRYNRFGIKFDHYFAFEYTFIEPESVFEKIPKDLVSTYHWYNVPVEASPTSKSNPWKSILSRYNESDFVVIKLDTDTASVEILLAHELMQEKYAPLVHHFYFEHQVQMKNMIRFWQEDADGTLQDSLDLFTSMRQVGIAAHSWV